MELERSKETCAEPRAPRVYGSKRRERCYERTRQRAPKPPKVKGSALWGSMVGLWAN